MEQNPGFRKDDIEIVPPHGISTVNGSNHCALASLRDGMFLLRITSDAAGSNIQEPHHAVLFLFRLFKSPRFKFQLLPEKVQFLCVVKRIVNSDMKGLMKSGRDRKRGQVMLEYVIALGVFISLVSLCAALIYVFRAYGNRVLDIISVS